MLAIASLAEGGSFVRELSMIDGLAPATLLLLLIVTACATLGHLLLGRSWLQIPFFWLASLLSCLLAFGLQWRFPLDLPSPAGVPVLEAVLLSFVVMMIVSRLRV